MIKISSKGDFSKTLTYFEKLKRINKSSILDKYGKMGVTALSAATPVRSGKTAASWTYEIQNTSTGAEIIWKNTNTNNGVNIAVIIQYGHGTRNGGYVRGIDYINPAMRPVFEQISADAWKEVTEL